MDPLHRQRSFDLELHTRAPPPPLVSQLSLQSNSGRSSKKKQLALRILLLDDGVTIIQAQAKAPGRLVFDQICKQLNVLEADYFGLEYLYQDSTSATQPDTYFWLDLDKPLSHQVGLSLADPLLRFSVKFYTPDPSQLEEEFTRYLYSLQIRRDLAGGQLLCNDNTAALMASYLVQAECGDFSEEDYPDASYLRNHLFVPNQDASLEYRIRENHKRHVGQTPGEADLHLLETGRRTEFYGVRMWGVKDDDSTQLNLSVCHSGVLVFQNYTKINTFSWGKIRKLSFKRKKFILKLHPEGFGYYKELVEFTFPHRNHCKSFWKSCVEHHSFFRCDQVEARERSKGLLSSRGSSFRYSGRTQKQMVSFVRENFLRRGGGGQPQQQSLQSSAQATPNSAMFQRSSSFRSTATAATTTPLLHHSAVSTSCSSPAVVGRHSPSTDDSFSPGTSINSSPQHQPMYPPIQQLQEQDPPDWFYFAVRELVQTQRTFVQDLRLLPNKLLPPNAALLQQLEASNPRKEVWDSGRNGCHSLGLLLRHLEVNGEVYRRYLEELDLESCDEGFEFYMPVTAIAMKPLYRLIYLGCDWVEVLTRNSGTATAQQKPDQLSHLTLKLTQVLSSLSALAKRLQPKYESQAKVIELQRELPGSCEQEPGEFRRQGLLLKLSSKRGLQSRLFFLFSNVLYYSSRVSSAAGFRLHGRLPLRDCTILDEPCDPIPNSFSIQYDSKLLVVGCSSSQDRAAWLRDLREAKLHCGEYKAEPFNSSSTELHPQQPPQPITENQVNHRANATTHVCWHRNLSFSHEEHCRRLERATSGYLLRKFKNSPGWQRLYVSFAGVCLYFYKGHEEPHPLASLPLLGYTVALPTPEEVEKRHVFKLVFKTHVYYFRAESPFTFGRWIAVLQSATAQSEAP